MVVHVVEAAVWVARVAQGEKVVVAAVEPHHRA